MKESALREFIELLTKQYITEADTATNDSPTTKPITRPIGSGATQKANAVTEPSTEPSTKKIQPPAQKQKPEVERRAPFNFADLGKQESYMAMVEYAARNLKSIGHGSSRITFDLKDGWVLKVAMNPSGQAQNNAEATVCSADPQMSYFTKIDLAKSDKNRRWLVSEYANPIDKTGSAEQLWLQHTGLSWQQYMDALEGLSRPNADPVKVQTAQTAMKNPWFSKLIEIVKTCKYQHGDLSKQDSWGVTKADKLVILDSGFTESVYNNYYKGNDAPDSNKASTGVDRNVSTKPAAKPMPRTGK